MRTIMRVSLHRSLPKLTLVVLLFSVVMMSACSSGPPPKLYLLESPDFDEQSVELAKKSAIKSLGMSPVELPGYASDAQIASLRDDGTIYQDDANRWAEEPVDSITRLLSARLRAHTEATVLIEPWPRDYAPVARVEVSFDKLLRQPDGGARMAGQILLLSGSGRNLLKAVPFNISHTGSDTDSRVFFLSLAKGIDEIARIAVEEIQLMNIKS